MQTPHQLKSTPSQYGREDRMEISAKVGMRRFCNPEAILQSWPVVEPAAGATTGTTPLIERIPEGLHGAAPSHPESDLRQTAIDEYFAPGHKAAVIGREEQGHGSRFVRVADTSKWCLTGKT